LAATFDCPQCGAPLGFDPKPGDETVECSFCHNTVIIPEELRVPLPKVSVPRQQPSKRRNGLVLVLVLGVVIIGICVGAALINTPSSPATVDSPTEPVISDTSNATATVEAQATNDALQPLLKQEQNWPVIFTDQFTDNTHKWPTGDVRDNYITGNRSLSNNVYTWNVTSVQSAFDSSFPNLDDQTDFSASVDMKYITMPDDPDADAGLVFRYNSTDQTWYYFSVNDNGQYYFGWYNGTDWNSLIPETDSLAIHSGESNRLTVGVRGSQFIFLINGQMVDHFIDENLKSGSVGLGVNLPKTGEKASIEFNNFTVASPPSTP
jgi:hypothetical protein